MIRYRANPVKARLLAVTENNFELEFTETVRGITPGQVAVLYLGDICLGGGFIQVATG